MQGLFYGEGIITTPEGSYEGNFNSGGKVVYTDKEGMQKDGTWGWGLGSFVPAEEDDEKEKHA